MLKLSYLNFRIAVFLICTYSGVAAQADAVRDADAIATRQSIATSVGHTIPSGAFGFVVIERPREVTLLQLRGLAGSGQVVLRTDQNGMCLTLPVRLVAGDLAGDSITGHLAEPIYVIIKSREVARALAKGRDVVSDGHIVSNRMDPDADIVLQSGLDESFGFVINPGRNILGDIFGVRVDRISCQRV
ncbi:MAG: hypothetical protein ABJI96_12055 [Paracoccaceae bacterium]